MGFTVRSRAGVFELTARPRVVPAEDIHTVAASLIADAAPRDGRHRGRVTLDALMSPALPEILGERWDARPNTGGGAIWHATAI